MDFFNQKQHAMEYDISFVDRNASSHEPVPKLASDIERVTNKRRAEIKKQR